MPSRSSPNSSKQRHSTPHSQQGPRLHHHPSPSRQHYQQNYVEQNHSKRIEEHVIHAASTSRQNALVPLIKAGDSKHAPDRQPGRNQPKLTPRPRQVRAHRPEPPSPKRQSQNPIPAKVPHLPEQKMSGLKGTSILLSPQRMAKSQQPPARILAAHHGCRLKQNHSKPEKSRNPRHCDRRTTTRHCGLQIIHEAEPHQKYLIQ
jgi:hypothetical protein